MNRAFAYLSRELAKSYAVIALALLVLFDLMAFLTEAEDVGDGRYGVLDALLVVVYATPALLVDLSPFIALLGTLNAYAALRASNEVTALRAAGMSSVRIGIHAVWFAAAFMVLIAGVELTARPLHLEATLLRMHETAPSGNPLRGSGFWIRTGSTFVNVAALEDAALPTAIRIFSFADAGQLQRYVRADAARVVSPSDWRLSGVFTKAYADDGGPSLSEGAAVQHWSPTWDQSTALYDLTPASYAMVELKHRIDQTDEATLARDARAEFWRRAALPLAAVAYALLATPFALLGAIRGGRATRLALGATAAFILYIGEQVAANVGILAGLPYAVTACVPPALILFGSAFLLRRLD